MIFLLPFFLNNRQELKVQGNHGTIYIAKLKVRLHMMFKRVSHWHDDALIKIERISWILSPSPAIPNGDPALWVSNEDDPENWHVQVT
jgi:hypothetical protein